MPGILQEPRRQSGERKLVLVPIVTADKLNAKPFIACLYAAITGPSFTRFRGRSPHAVRSDWR